jgi:predicted SAM-dependent methyltransferase
MIKDRLLNRFGYGMRKALRTLRSELKIMRMHRRAVKKAGRYRDATDLKLHFGCGPNLKPGFINIDLSPAADLTLDLREPLPFSSNSCGLIYSEHFLEHVEYPDMVLALLRDCLRVLRPGGIFSVGVPDTEWPLLEYAKTRSDGYFDLVKRQWHPKYCVTEMEHVNYHFRQGDEHKFAYDFQTLQHVLTQAGFKNVVRRQCNPDLDQASWAVGTLFVDAVKE